MTSDSTMTDVSTWRRDAPSVRKVANSRVRWAIVIDERVRDHEAADEERDAGEREQEALEERDEALTCPSRPLAPAPVASRACVRRRQDAA